MRIQGRVLRPSNLAERRLLLSLGVDTVAGLRVPRDENPFQIARRIRRIAAGTCCGDLAALKAFAKRLRGEAA